MKVNFSLWITLLSLCCFGFLTLSNADNSIACNYLDPLTNRFYNFSSLSLTDKNYTVIDSVYTYKINICSPLPGFTNTDTTQTPSIIQIENATGRSVAVGMAWSTRFQKINNTITMTVKGGDKCHHVDVERSASIRFICNPDVVGVGAPVFEMETYDCNYIFNWTTPLACISGANVTNLRPCLDSDYVSQYTECDTTTNTRSAVSYLIGNCDPKNSASPTIQPILNLPCNIVCPPGSFLPFGSRSCQTCSPGTYSLGGATVYNDFSSGVFPSAFITDCVRTDSNTAPCNSWKVSSANDSLVSGSNQNNHNIESSITLNARFILPKNNNTIRFTYKVDAENCACDGLVFSIDGVVKIALAPGPFVWQTVQFNVSSGWHTFKWTYKKDYSVSIGQDMLFIRSIELIGTKYALESSCISCGTGYFSKTSGSTSCQACDWFEYANENGLDECKKCSAGTYSTPASVTCTTKPNCTNADLVTWFTGCSATTNSSGTFLTRSQLYRWQKPGDAPTYLCNDSFIALPAVKTGLPCLCPPGTFLNTVTATCDFCPNGHANRDPTATTCTPCGPGFAAVKGRYYTQWDDVPALFQTFGSGAWTSGWIARGSFISSDPRFGTFDSYLTTAATFVTAGYVSFNYSLTCQSSNSPDCSLSFIYYNSTGFAQQLTYSYSTSFASVTVPLPVGNYNFTWQFHQVDATRTQRNEGRLLGVSLFGVLVGGAATCSQCTAGYASAGAPSILCSACEPGSFSSTGAASCRKCDVGTFTSAPASSMCIPCGAYTTSNANNTDCTYDCTYVPSAARVLGSPLSDIKYNLTLMTNKIGMHLAGVYESHRYWINICSRTHTNASCYDAAGVRIPTYSCQESFGRGYSVDTGSVIGFADSTTTTDALSGLTVQFTQGTYGCASYYNGTAMPRKTIVRLICDVNAGLGIPTAVENSTVVEVPAKSCTYLFEWKSLYACPVCVSTRQQSVLGACISGRKQISYVSTIPCWNANPAQTTFESISCETSLKKLTINVVPSLVFSETQYTTYIGPLPSNTKDMTLTVASKDDTSFVEVQGVRLGNSGTAKIPLSAGANTTVIIKVTSEDGSTQNYFVIAKVEEIESSGTNIPIPALVVGIIAFLGVVTTTIYCWWRNRNLKYQYYNLLNNQPIELNDTTKSLAAMEKTGYNPGLDDIDDHPAEHTNA